MPCSWTNARTLERTPSKPRPRCADVCTKVIPLTIPVSEMVYGAGDLAEEGAYLIVTGAVQLLSPAAPSKRKKIGGTSGGTSARAKHTRKEGVTLVPVPTLLSRSRSRAVT